MQRSNPFDIATCMYYTGIDPFTKEEVNVAKGLRDRKMLRALMQFFKPENYFTVREALIQAGRGDLIGNGCDCLVPTHPPKEALEARRWRANEAACGDHYHTVANPAKGESAGEHGLPNRGYRPGRKSAKRQPGKNRNWKDGSSGPRPWSTAHRPVQTSRSGPECPETRSCLTCRQRSRQLTTRCATDC